MREALSQLPGDASMEVAISTGSEHWRAGEIVLSIDGSGEVAVLHRRSGAEHSYAGAVEPDALERLAGDWPLWTLRVPAERAG